MAAAASRHSASCGSGFEGRGTDSGRLQGGAWPKGTTAWKGQGRGQHRLRFQAYTIKTSSTHLHLVDVGQQGLHLGRGHRRAARPRAKLPLRLVAAAVQLQRAAGRGALDADVAQQRLLQGGHHAGKQRAEVGHLAAAGAGAQGGEGGGVSGGGQGGAGWRAGRATASWEQRGAKRRAG